MLGKIGHFFVAMFVAAFIFGVFVVLSGVNTGDFATTSDMVYGRANKPFVYRALLPMTARTIAAITPTAIRSDINESFAATDFVQTLPDVYIVEDQYLYEIFLVNVLMYIALIGFIYSMRFLTASVFQISDKRNNLASLVALLLIVQGFVFGYIYDFSALLLMTLSYGLLVRKNLLAYVLLFPLVTLNKETSILLILVYWLHFHTMEDKRTFYTYLAAQIGTFVIIKIALYWAFRDNLGDSFEFHLPEHFIEYQRIFREFPLLIIYYFVIMIGPSLLMAYRWEEKPLFLQNALLTFGPLFFLYLLFGFPFELRVFYEIYPIVFLIILHSMGRLLGHTVTEVDWDRTSEPLPVPSGI